MEKSTKNQELRTLDLAVLGVLVCISVLLVLAVLMAKRPDPTKKRAMILAENLSLQLAAGGLGNLQNPGESAERTMASKSNPTAYKLSIKLFGHQGRISRDPWGSAYRYKFLEEDDGHVYVLVWSDGPNKTKDTDSERLQVYRDQSRAFLVLQGDDLGVIHEITKPDQES